MKNKKIEQMRNDLGHFLHDYYVKFGEEKYDEFVDKLALSMMKDYGEPFSSDNLRIMEAEYVMLTSKLPSEKKNDEEEPKKDINE